MFPRRARIVLNLPSVSQLDGIGHLQLASGDFDGDAIRGVPVFDAGASLLLTEP